MILLLSLGLIPQPLIHIAAFGIFFRALRQAPGNPLIFHLRWVSFALLLIASSLAFIATAYYVLHWQLTGEEFALLIAVPAYVATTVQFGFLYLFASRRY